MEPVRILHVLHRLSRGGLESRIMDIYRNIDRNRFQYDFYIESGNIGDYDKEVLELGGRIFYSKDMRAFNVPGFKTFKNFLFDHPEYRIVYAYDQWSGLYLKQAQKTGVPYRIASARNSFERINAINIVRDIVKKNVNRYASHRHAVSKKAACWLFGRGKVDANEVMIWPNAIDVKKFSFSKETRDAVRSKLGLSDCFVVIHVGNIKYQKNHPFLLQIFSQICNRYRNARLLLIGGGDIDSLKPLMDKYNISDNILYLGVRNDVQDILQAGDVFVFPSFYEGFPGAVLEAETSGLYCIISDTITDEVALSDNVKMISLKRDPKVWAEAVDASKNYDRENAWRDIKDAGYDINDLIDKTHLFYESLKL